MKLPNMVTLIVVAAILGLGYNWHAQSVGRLEGEIEARGESIKQLGTLAAKKQQEFQQAKRSYVLKPSLETCSVALSSCEQMHQADSSQIVLLTKQVESYKKLRKSGKLFGVLPRPRVLAGVCLDAQAKVAPCLSAGFPIF